jgi:NitT/TauT family transport system ATP-binding protein
VLLSDRIIVMTPRPGRIREILPVPLARPRSVDTLSDPDFIKLSNYIRRQLFSHSVA